MVCEIEGTTLVNAGAFASGNLITRQLIQTVALLFVLENGRIHITHIDVNSQEIHQPQDVVELPFPQALKSYSGSILSPDLQKRAAQFQGKPEPYLRETLWKLASECWWGEKDVITLQDIREAANGKLDYLT